MAPRLSHLEEGALAQRVVADVQVAGGAGGRRRALGRGLAFGVGHAKLARLGEHLEVVGRHRPELEVRLVAEEPADAKERAVSVTRRDDHRCSVLELFY